MANLDPLAAAGFAPVQGQIVAPSDNPLAAAGFSPAAPPAPPPREVKTLGVDMSGAPVFADPADQKVYNDINLRGMEKMGEGATMGTLPYGVAAARTLGGVPFQQGLKEARDYTAQTSKEQPVLSGIGETAGGLLPVAGVTSLARPLVGMAAKAVPYVGSTLAQTMLGAGIGGVNAAGHDIGAGTTEKLGTDTATGAGIGAGFGALGELGGRALQAIPNAAQSLYAGAKNIFTDAGKRGIVGQVLRESGGDFPNQNATSAIPGLTLRVPQATGNPGLASLESALASEPRLQSGDIGNFVTNNRTPDQVSALARSLVGSDAGMEPTVLTNQASARGVGAIRNLDEALHGTEQKLWGTPILKQPNFNGSGIAAGVGQDVASFPASWRDAVTGPQNKLGAYMRELHELGPNASLADINSVRSRLLGVARDAASGPQPDSVTAAAANSMAKSILARTGADPAIAGTAPVITPGRTEMHYVPGEGDVPVFIEPTVTPGKDANPEAWKAYQTARDFTRQYNGAKGFNEFNSILHPNSQGNMQGNAERQFGQFFDPAGGTSAGLQRLQGLTDFARQTGHQAPASELENATRQYINAAILKQSRAGTGLSPTGQPNLNLATMASTTNKMAPALNATLMTAPMAGDIQATGNAAELLNRPSTMRGSTNSTTYERLKQNDLVNAVLGQSATTGLGVGLGGYAGYRYGPENVPWYLRVPAGMMAGGLAANTLGPAAGTIITHTPGLRAIGAGRSENIRRQLMDAMSNMPAYNRAVATPMLSGPAIGQPGPTLEAMRALMQGGVIPATGGTGR